MKSNITFAAFLLLLAFSSENYSQNSYKLPNGLSLSNQLEYSYNSEKQTEVFENWLNLDYTYGIFSTGIRFEVFQPNDPDPSISRGKETYSDIAYKYID